MYFGCLVILDLRRVWDAPVQAFLAEFTAADRLHFFEGDVTRAEDWLRLCESHGTAFTHVVSGAALTPTRADEERRPKDVMAVNTFGTIEALEWALEELPDVNAARSSGGLTDEYRMGSGLGAYLGVVSDGASPSDPSPPRSPPPRPESGGSGVEPLLGLFL